MQGATWQGRGDTCLDRMQRALEEAGPLERTRMKVHEFHKASRRDDKKRKLAEKCAEGCGSGRSYDEPEKIIRGNVVSSKTGRMSSTGRRKTMEMSKDDGVSGGVSAIRTTTLGGCTRS